MRSRIQFLLILFTVTYRPMDCQVNASPASSPDETAALIGVSREIQELRTLDQPVAAGSPQQWRTLALHQQIYERVMTASLEVDAATATIDNEIARSAEVRGFLADKRDRNVTRANLLSALFGGGLGGTSAGLQLSSRQTNATVATGIAGGAISLGLAFYGIRAQRGSSWTLDADSNLLAPFFDRPQSPVSRYPPLVWQFLGEVAPSDPDHLTRRERLIRTWLDLKRLDSLTTPSGRVKIEHVTSMPEEHLKLTVDDLEDRIAMLQDVRAKLSYLKRDLAVLLASLPDLNQPADRGSSAH
ncbi:MAG TPA: hypothetical protein VNH18_05025 [Bryobacteraceae bacterium]|nr:hypothetical protein [Bryobacteraceae bacterium]